MALFVSETGRITNQIGSLDRAEDTGRSSSQFNFICSFIRKFHSTSKIIQNIIIKDYSYSQRMYFNLVFNERNHRRNLLSMSRITTINPRHLN